MTTKEANKIVFDMGYHPYSASAMVDALLKGVEIGKAEQRAIDDDHFRDVRKMVIDKACEIYEKELRQMQRILNEIKEGAGDIISVGGSMIQFRKALEGNYGRYTI